MMMSAGVRMFFGTVSVSKEMYGFFQVRSGMRQDEYGNANGQQWINDNKIGEVHDNGADQYSCPSQYIFQHMQVYGFLVQGMAAMGEISGTEIDADPYNSKQEHAVVMDADGMQDPADGIDDNQTGTEKQERRHQNTAEDGISGITVSAFSFQKICSADADGIKQIVYGIGKDGDASCQDTADTFKYGKQQIQYKSNKDTFFCLHKDLLLT